MRTFLALVIASAAIPAIAADPAYPEAKARARSDSLNVELRQWYLQDARPAVGGFFQALMGACLGVKPPSELPGFGVVFTIDPAGQVVRVIWRESNWITPCLERGLRGATLPGAPTNEFYFGLEVQPSRPSA